MLRIALIVCCLPGVALAGWNDPPFVTKAQCIETLHRASQSESYSKHRADTYSKYRDDVPTSGHADFDALVAAAEDIATAERAFTSLLLKVCNSYE